MQNWPNKDPDEVKDYSIDWSGHLIEGEEINGSVWVVPSGITEDTSAFSETQTVIWLSDGIDGTLYTFVNRITTNQNRTFEETVGLLVTKSLFGLVALPEVKAMLRILHDEDDYVLQMIISAASQSIATHLKQPNLLLVESPPVYIDPRIKIATIMLVGHIYRSPDRNVDNAFEFGFLPKPVTAILYNMRDPTIA